MPAYPAVTSSQILTLSFGGGSDVAKRAQDRLGSLPSRRYGLGTVAERFPASHRYPLR